MLVDLKHFFMQRSYKEMNTNSNLLTVLYQPDGEDVLVLVLNDLVSGIEATKEQYDHVLWQVEQAFYKNGFRNVNILSIICTKNIDRVKVFCSADAYTHWIIDQNTKRVLIYENQQRGYWEIQKQIEQFLEGKAQPVREPVYTNYGQTKETLASKAKRLYYRYPVVTIGLVVANVIVFLLCALTGSTEDTMHLYDWGASAYGAVVNEHEYYRLFTAMFLHAGPEHLINNMFVLIIIGERLEKILGKIRYTLVYLVTGLAASVGSIIYYQLIGENVVGVGASGAIFGVIGGIFYMVVRYRGRQTGITTNRMILFLMLSLYSGVSNASQVDNTAHVVGCLSGIIMTFIMDELQRRKGTRRNK
ncbi:MAG: rhomboid family intramembrane serine protease [bacterium]|nr:rhomboid family intramembrane serine protease [bacterium]